MQTNKEKKKLDRAVIYYSSHPTLLSIIIDSYKIKVLQNQENITENTTYLEWLLKVKSCLNWATFLISNKKLIIKNMPGFETSGIKQKEIIQFIKDNPYSDGISIAIELKIPIAEMYEELSILEKEFVIQKIYSSIRIYYKVL
jgi:hypothetical protein